MTDLRELIRDARATMDLIAVAGENNAMHGWKRLSCTLDRAFEIENAEDAKNEGE